MDDQSCQCTSDESKRRQFAYSMIHQSHDHLRQDRLPLARKLLAAAREMLQAFGGVKGEEGVWLLTAEAHVPLKKEDHDSALALFKQALELSQLDLGDQHFATGVCHVNIAETLLNLGQLVEAEDHNSAAMDILADALQENKDDMLAEYLADTIKEAERVFEQVRGAESK